MSRAMIDTTTSSSTIVNPRRGRPFMVNSFVLRPPEREARARLDVGARPRKGGRSARVRRRDAGRCVGRVAMHCTANAAGREGAGRAGGGCLTALDAPIALRGAEWARGRGPEVRHRQKAAGRAQDGSRPGVWSCSTSDRPPHDDLGGGHERARTDHALASVGKLPAGGGPHVTFRPETSVRNHCACDRRRDHAHPGSCHGPVGARRRSVVGLPGGRRAHRSGVLVWRCGAGSGRRSAVRARCSVPRGAGRRRCDQRSPRGGRRRSRARSRGRPLRPAAAVVRRARRHRGRYDAGGAAPRRWSARGRLRLGRGGGRNDRHAQPDCGPVVGIRVPGDVRPARGRTLRCGRAGNERAVDHRRVRHRARRRVGLLGRCGPRRRRVRVGRSRDRRRWRRGRAAHRGRRSALLRRRAGRAAGSVSGSGRRCRRRCALDRGERPRRRLPWRRVAVDP